jgi:tetratricopeptide (TPR) repeat protein
MDELLPPTQSDASIEGAASDSLPLFSPVQSILDPLAEIEHLLYLGKLPAAVRLAQASIVSPEWADRANLLLVRCLMLQGHFQQAEGVCKTVLESLSSEDEITREMRLWHAFLQIYVIGDPTLAITEGRTSIAWARLQSGIPRLTARVQVLLGKALALAADWGLVPVTNIVEARNLLAEAVKVYRESGVFDDSLSALLSLGQFYLMGLDADPTKAQAIFQEVQDQSLATGNQVRLADALLRLAELDFDTVQTHGSATLDSLLNLPYYQKALDLYQQAGYALGPADVWLSLGRRLLGIGLDGTHQLQQALRLYRQEENLTGIQSTLSALGTWYVQQGKLNEALEYHQQNAEVTCEMGFPLGQSTAYLGLGDYFFRVGDYAKALAYYEQAEKLAVLPIVGAIAGLTLANTYTLMHLPDRAKRACRRVIEVLAPAGPSNRLSLARYILGNVISSTGDWTGAIVAWRDGLAEDEARQDRLSQAEKLQNIAQATVMQYYRTGGPPVAESAYQEAMSLYSQSIELLKGHSNPQADAVIASAYQLQGQTAVTCGYPIEGAKYFEQATRMYSALGLDMQAAATNTLVGLLYYDLGNRGYTDLYAEAVRSYQQALDYFQKAHMLDIAWKVLLYLALTSFHCGRLALTAEEQQSFWHYGAQCLEEAGTAIEFVRGRFIEANSVDAQTAALGLVADKEKVYVTAVQLYYHYLHDTKSALTWLERFKGRAFLDALALTSLRPPALADETLLSSESKLLAALHHATTQTEVVEVNEQLRTLWDNMSAIPDPAVAEYVLLRRGDPISWKEIGPLLKLK